MVKWCIIVPELFWCVLLAWCTECAMVFDVYLLVCFCMFAIFPNDRSESNESRGGRSARGNEREVFVEYQEKTRDK